MKRLPLILLFLVLAPLTIHAQSHRVSQRKAREFVSHTIEGRGKLDIPVILIGFQDVRFTVDNPEEAIKAKLQNEVTPYFTENSTGVFEPVFHIEGLVSLERPLSYYGANLSSGEDRAPELALCEACKKLTDADFSIYDSDSDGYIDLILFYYAGYDEADYGPSESIWSHHGDAAISIYKQVSSAEFDGKKLGLYLCASELAGNSGTRLCGIGTTCHELCHALGLPDFYDTSGSADGFAGGMYNFSIMGTGCYNNMSATPPYLNALERCMLGWMESIPELPEGEVSFGPVRENAAFRSPTGTEGEYFIWEYRDAYIWDSPLPQGLLVYHIDTSEREVEGTEYTAYELWDWRKTGNCVNAYGTHPCAYIIPSSAPQSLNYQGEASGIVFPGASSTDFFEPVDWDGLPTGVKVSEISGSGAYVRKYSGPGIGGRVLDESGAPVAGCVISTDIESSPEAVTGADGRFFIGLEEGSDNLPYRLSTQAEGFRKADFDAVLAGSFSSHDITLIREGEALVTEIRKYDSGADKIFYPLPSRDFGDCMAAVKFTPQELFLHTGKRLDTISFDLYIQGAQAEAVYVIVDFGSERVLTLALDEPNLGVLARNVVDVSAYGLRIPEGEDVYVGYGVRGSGYAYPLGVTITGHEGNSYYDRLNLESSAWEPMYSARSKTGFMDLLLSAELSEVTAAESLAEMGYAMIDIGNPAPKAGDFIVPKLIPGLETPLKVTWIWDGEVMTEDNVNAAPGSHTLKAVLEYRGGRTETIKKVVNTLN